MTHEQEQMFKHELESDKSLKNLFIEISTYFKNGLQSSVEFDTDSALEKVSKRINVTKTLYLKVASMVATIAIGLFLVINNIDVKPEYITITNTSNKVKHLSLNDGSKIALNQNSSVKYIKNFQGNIRFVELSGEGYFKVSKDKTRPFIVDVDGAKITVLGTSFNIKEKRDNILLSVNSGRVLFKSKYSQDSLILTKNQSASIIKNEVGIKKIASFDSNFNSWITKQLKFKNTKLSQVCKSLSNYYDTTVVLKNQSDSNLILNSNFNNQKINDVIDLIEFALETDLEVK